MASSIGGGGRIGPNGPIVPAQEADTPKKSDGVDKHGGQAASDGFERGLGGKRGDSSKLQIPAKVEAEAKFNELLKQTSSDPRALAHLTQALNAVYGKYAGEFAADKAKVQTLLDHLDGGALESVRSELASLRERMALARHRMATQKRRLRALKQLAGRVSEPRLAEEIANIEAELAAVELGWEATYVGLGLGKVTHGEQHADTPAHLRKVVKAHVQGMKKNPREAEEVGELLTEIHPGRAVAGLAARQIDGAPKVRPSQEVLERVRGEAKGKHGRSLAAYAALYELFDKVGEETDDAPTPGDGGDK
jgi:hypothetical protein